MTSTTSTLSPLVAGAADLARKLAAYKATSNTASGVREDEYAGEVIPSPLDVSFCPKTNDKKNAYYLLSHEYSFFVRAVFLPSFIY